jgi:MHS family proline/betaine transporter-like MFS transporter
VLFAPLGLYLRRHLSEPEPVAAAEAARVEPLTHAVLANAPAIGVGIGLTCLWNITLFILLFYMPTYVQHQLGVSADAAFSSTAVGAAVLFVLCPFMGALSDRVGRKAVMLTAAVLLCLCAYPLLQHLQNHRRLLDLIEVQGALAVLIAGYTAPIAAMLAELFPTQSRSTALSVAYNISTLLVGAFSPLVVTWLIVVTHNPLAPAFYVSGGAAVSALTLLLVRDQTGKPLRL